MTSQTLLADVVDVARTRLITIHDTWVGYNAHSPIRATYDLARAPDRSFRGQGLLSTSLSGERFVDVAIPLAEGRHFLREVGQSTLAEAAPSFACQHTDDYPRIEVTLQVDMTDIGSLGGVCVLFTESQGPDHVPWGVFVGGRTYSTENAGLTKALRSLSAHLHRDLLDRMSGIPLGKPAASPEDARRRPG